MCYEGCVWPPVIRIGRTLNVDWQTIRPQQLSVPRSSAEVLEEVLVSSEPMHAFLESAAELDEPILLCINDSHRSTQTNPALRALAEFVRQLVGRDTDVDERRKLGPRFRALIATGAHRFVEDQRRAFEKATFADCGLHIEGLAWHDATDEGDLVPIGGVRMHRWIDESRFLLPIGSVEPHYFAGATGPHKTVTIGCLSRDDIERNHSGALNPSSDILRLRGNPVYDGVVEIIDRLKSDGKKICAIGEVVCGNTVVAAAVGDPIEATDELLPVARRIYVQQIDRQVDMLRLRVPLPLGRSLYQADKALKNNHQAVRDGGGILLEAECPEGIGPDAFITLLRRCDSYANATDVVSREGYRLGDHKAVKLRYLMDPTCRNVRVALVSPHLSAPELQGTGIELFPSADSALCWLLDSVSDSVAAGLIVEDAGMVCVTPHGLDPVC